MPSVTSCAYDYKVRSASFDEHNLGSYEIGYIVETSGLMGPQSVANGALLGSPHALPSLWSTYSYNGDTDNYSWARDYNVTPDPKSTKLYYITVQYRPNEPGEGSSSSGGDPINAEPDPLAREPVIWWDREVQTKVALRDQSNAEIVNPCQDYYPEDIELEVPKGILVVEINVETAGDVALLSRTFDCAVNASSWTFGGEAFPARTVCCREVSSGPAITEAGYVFYHVVFRFAFAEDGYTWDEGKLECGQFHWSKTSGSYDMFAGFREVTDAQKIVALDTDGTRLPDGDPYVFKYWRVRREVNFNGLPF